MSTAPPPCVSAGMKVSAGGTWKAEPTYRSMNPLNLGTWKTRVVTARQTRSVASRYAGTRENQPAPRPVPEPASPAPLARRPGTKLHYTWRAGGRVVSPPDPRDVRVSVTLLPCEVGNQTREPVVNLVFRHVERQHWHGFGRSVTAHVALDVRYRLGLAPTADAKEADFVAWHEPRIHRPAEPGPAISKRRDLELLYERDDDLDGEPRDDERRCRTPAPAADFPTGHVRGSEDLMIRRFPEGSSGMRSTGSTVTPTPRKLSSSCRIRAPNSDVNRRVGTTRNVTASGAVWIA